jgi:hypothetical protein
MRRMNLIISGVGLALILFAGAASAEEIVFFANGSTMPIRAHEIHGEMLHVDLGSDGFMAFPLYMVDKIEKAGQNVILKPSHTPGNQILATTGGTDARGSRPVRGTTSSRRDTSTNGKTGKTDREIAMDGIAKGQIGAPIPDSNHTTGRANMKDSFDPRVQRNRSRSNYINTKQIGSKRVVGVDDTVRRGPVPVSFSEYQKAPPPPAKEGSGSSSSKSDSSSGSKQ